MTTVIDADFEIGSISKGVTGLLYADAIERGKVTPETPLSELLPLENVPVGLDRCYVPADGLEPGALIGVNRHGRRREPWTGEAIAPAGGIRATIGSMATLTRALLEGTAPGVAALDPVAPFGIGSRIGAAWITIEAKGRVITWHNGGTGGFRTWLGLDRGAGRGVVVLSATAASVDRHGFALLTGNRAPV